MTEEFSHQIPGLQKHRVASHLNRQIAPEAHSPMYIWHKFWSRKTWNVVGEFVRTYCPPGGIVFDPFAGSGVTAIEALKNGRRVIISDILPISTEIVRLTIKPVSPARLMEAYRRVEAAVKEKILQLYETECRKCGHKFPFTCALWQQKRKSPDALIDRWCLEIRYASCPFCGDRREKNTAPNKFDRELLQKIGQTAIKEWYPRQKLYHANGQPFKEKQKYESLDELFTKRNLYALAILMDAIEKEKNKDLRDFLKIGFSSMVHLATSMMPDRPSRPFSGGWTEHSYWFANTFLEQNVWDLFESAITGKQGLIRAKEESNKYFQNVRFGKSFAEVIENRTDIFIYTGSCSDLMKEMIEKYENGCADYIFTDPPYDSSVQYGELAFLWVAWLKKDAGYLEKILADEVIHNEKQEKNFDYYHRMLSRTFREIFSVLMPDNYLTVTFHNPTFKVRNATIYAAVTAGFDLQKIHHQELARPSAKSLLQPFGSVHGDLFLRFHKPQLGERAISPSAIDELRFEKIATETTIRIIAERGEPTPYTIIINAIDPELAKQGFFSELNTGLDVKTVLEKHLEKEFILKDKLWWFKNPSIVPHLQSIPLTERVEQTVLRKLQEKVKVTFTEMWNAVSVEFPNSLTSDTMSIIDALKTYARPKSGGSWYIKPGLHQNEIDREHTTVLAMLALIGQAKGCKIWVGKVEQNHEITALPKISGRLGQFVNSYHPGETIENIDMLWINKGKIIASFEVESTTQMTEALRRGSNLEAQTPKYLLMPEDREPQFLRKLKSPMFGEQFSKDNWKVVFFETLKEEFTRHQGKTDINQLVDRKLAKPARTADQISFL